MRAINDGQKTLSAIKEEMVKVCCSILWGLTGSSRSFC